jgi:hypothetical protein
MAGAILDGPGREARGLSFQKRVLDQFAERSWLDGLRRAYARF